MKPPSKAKPAKRRSVSSIYRSGVFTMKKLFKILGIIAAVLVCSLVIAKYPGLVFGLAKAIVWTAKTITGGADSALALVNGPNS